MVTNRANKKYAMEHLRVSISTLRLGFLACTAALCGCTILFPLDELRELGQRDAALDERGNSATISVNDSRACADDCTPTSLGDDEAKPGLAVDDGTDDLSKIPEDQALPIIFVHGFLGSAQQFSSQAIRYVANGYPAERLRAYDHNGVGALDVIDEFVSGLDELIDEARAAFEVDQVFLIGHSRGTFVSSTYLSESGNAEKVAKYISLDGSGCDMIPTSVPCISPSQEGGGGTHPLPGQKHVEVATSKESFAVQWEFLFGEPPKVVVIVKQRAPVEISGRAVNFPANTGRAGTILSIWEVEKGTGRRIDDEELGRFEIDETGEWGPVVVNPDSYYELVLSDEGGGRFHHFYPQRFLRTDRFVRLLSGLSDSAVRVNTNAVENHSALTVVRMREWTQADRLEVSTTIDGMVFDAGNVVTADLGEANTLVFLHDDVATPGETTLDPLVWFSEQPFQAGLDVFMPASDPPSGIITLTNLPRGDMSQPQTIHIPNWSSNEHEITAIFSDFPQPGARP